MHNPHESAAEGEAEDLRELFEDAPCGYISAGADGRVMRVNRTFLTWTGHKAEEVVGQHFHNLLTIPGKIYYETHFAPLLRMQGSFNEVALDIVRADRTKLPVLVNAVERRGDGGELRFIRITIFNASDRRRYEQELLQARATAERANAELRELNASLGSRVELEVAERLRAEDALRQAQKMEAIGQLTGGIAHDFNNLLQIITGSLDILQRNLPADAVRLRRTTDNAVLGAKRAATLVQRLLAFSRQQPLDPKPLDVNKLVRDTSELLQRTLGETVEIETVLSGRVWPVEADLNQLENALINLAVNARDAMPLGGKLTIETSNTLLDKSYAQVHAEVTPGQYVMISVSDTGTGMDEATAARIFEPFFTTKDSGKGTGLGLSQVYGFVKQSNGHISVCSQPGHGTTMQIYLPKAVGNFVAETQEIEEPAPEGLPTETILVVEDDAAVRHYSMEVLRELGYRVLEAHDSASAISLLRDARLRVDLLFSDVVLPGKGTGTVLAREARQFRPELKVLFTTGYAGNAIMHQGRLDPSTQLITKPFTYAGLAGKVRDVLNSP